MCVFLCVLFKTDGRFTLAEMGDKQLRGDGGNCRDTKTGTPPSRRLLWTHMILSLACIFFNYSGVKISYDILVYFNEPGS